jgi:hypothetical protein
VLAGAARPTGLSTWLSYDDLERLVVAALTAPVVGHTVIYGMSANRSLWWDNRSASHIGIVPRDSGEPWRAELEAAQPAVDRNDPVTLCRGGPFVTLGPFQINRTAGRSAQAVAAGCSWPMVKRISSQPTRRHLSRAATLRARAPGPRPGRGPRRIHEEGGERW